MMRSLFTAVSGLRNHQTRMDVIGNNIANVNTIGFQPSRVVFQDVYSQTIRPAAGADPTVAGIGGINPNQIGLGMTIGSIDVKRGSSVPQTTGETWDMMIDGDGYFVVESGGENLFTRAGDFRVDGEGYLTTRNGGYVMGWWTGNEDAAPPYTGTGNPPEVATPALNNGGGTTMPTTGTYELAQIDRIQIDPSYKNCQVDSSGQIIGTHIVTGQQHVIGQVSVATFTNDRALEKVAGNLYRQTRNTGELAVQNPNVGYAGGITPGAIEMAQVDIAEEFSNMIITQRGFQANSRIITVSDQMLEELVNMKR